MYIAVITFSYTESDLLFVANMSESLRHFYLCCLLCKVMDYQRNCNPIFVFSLWEANVFISSKKHTHQKNVQNITKHCRCSEMFQTKNTHTNIWFDVQCGRMEMSTILKNSEVGSNQICRILTNYEHDCIRNWCKWYFIFAFYFANYYLLKNLINCR